MSIFERNKKFFELSNHLGTVLATVSDEKIGVDLNNDGQIDYYTAGVVSANDYYPFGMTMPGRSFVTPTPGRGYRYGFNGKENDKDITEGAQDYGMRISDSRLGRFLSVDPITSKYPELTTYQFASNRPIDGIDQDGLEWELSTIRDQNAQKAKIGVATVQLAANSSPWQKAHPGESPSRVANKPSNVGIPPNMSPSERQHAQVLFNIQLQYEGFNYDLSKKPGTKLLDNKTYQNFSNNIALPVLEIASIAEGIGGLKALFKVSEKALPSRLIRVVEEKYAQSPTLGAPSAQDVFVTEASQLKGLKTSDEIAKKLTLVDKNGTFMDIPVILTPYSGDIDPLLDYGLFKRTYMTMLQFFS